MYQWMHYKSPSPGVTVAVMKTHWGQMSLTGHEGAFWYLQYPGRRDFESMNSLLSVDHAKSEAIRRVAVWSEDRFARESFALNHRQETERDKFADLLK